MNPSILALLFVLSIDVAVPRPASAGTQDATRVAGLWTLNRELSQLPPEIGFRVDWLSKDGSSQDPTGSGGRGGRGSGSAGAAALMTRRESEEDARRLQQLTEEVRNPSARLTIAVTPTAVTITDDHGQSRTFHPDGREEVLQLDGVPVRVTTKHEAGRLLVLYQVEQGRELRYAYSRTESPAQLVVDVQFVQRGGGDKVRRVYEPASAADTSAPVTAESARTPAKPDAGLPVVSGSAALKGSAPSTGRPAPEVFNQQPDAELKGLTALGVVVEDLSPQAAACGLNQGTLETDLSKRLTEAGFRVRRNSDEDTYLYVNVITTSLSTGLCVSRYDAFLYTHTTAKLSYQETPVLVQVSLLHKGGIAGGAPANHGAAVLRGLQEYVDQFSTRIRDANK
jgi:hypothetical protein